MKTEYRDGDIVRWQWNEKTLKKLKFKVSAGTLYWCQSRIAIFNESRGLFVDTYWGSSSSSSHRFDLDTAKEKMLLVDVANLDGLEECRKDKFNYYDQEDCVNLSHPNMTKGGFYIRKGAEKSLPKMKRVIEAHILHYQQQAETALQQVESLSKDLENVTQDSYLPCNQDVFI